VSAGAALAPHTHASEIVIGTQVDLSGPLSGLGTAVRNGLVMAFDETNAAGGVNGRRLRLIAIDNGYDTAKAVAATKTLLKRDHIFAMLCPVGTPQVAATMPLVLNSGVLHLFPFTSADDTYVQSQPLEFAIDLPEAEQISIGLGAILDMRGNLRVGVLYRDDDFGRAALKGAADEVARRGQQLAATASFAPGAENFGRAIATLRNAGVELVVIGAVSPEALAALQQTTARGWYPISLCGSACYVPELPTLGGRTVSGLYAVATTPIPYPDDSDPALRDWVKHYERRFGTVASAEALRAYLDARFFADALKRAGANPSERRVAHMLEAMSPWRDHEFGGIPIAFTSEDHVGFHTGLLAQVRNGRWAAMTGPLPTQVNARAH
jgi:ABC-type branched-subunit amino acid transport system substrate-binding protein